MIEIRRREEPEADACTALLGAVAGAVACCVVRLETRSTIAHAGGDVCLFDDETLAAFEGCFEEATATAAATARDELTPRPLGGAGGGAPLKSAAILAGGQTPPQTPVRFEELRLGTPDLDYYVKRLPGTRLVLVLAAGPEAKPGIVWAELKAAARALDRDPTSPTTDLDPAYLRLTAVDET